MTTNTEKIKDVETLKGLTTKRLLAYYKKRRKECKRLDANHTCDCCGSKSWEMHPNSKSVLQTKNDIDTFKLHLAEVKALLNERENVKK